ncbi:hypothetical protein MAR_010332 [Mya arenaria]|uniref:Uncharacterized protein n=1 Tax=Mya arenaria TaxID=6604 RepID=A0ABY7E3I7_MYAAR|nr:uncharacterized protein LOC128230132 [Mya arenaria]WAR03774.1 hypothetical protein MAR_010332 [Mya arenaria]
MKRVFSRLACVSGRTDITMRGSFNVGLEKEVDRFLRTATATRPQIELEDGGNGRPEVNKKIVERYVVYDQAPRNEPGAYHVYKMTTRNRLHVNLEDLPVQLHKPFIKFYVKHLTEKGEYNSSNLIQFNNICEDVFRYFLNMQIKKLGYSSVFTRYNHERGLALFETNRKETGV